MLKIYTQENRFKSPWSLKTKIKIFLWELIWFFFCKWTPKPFNHWRILILKIFGAKISGMPFVHQRAIISHPWNLILHDGATIGDKAVLYALDTIEVKELATIAQESYICTGTHNFSSNYKELMTDKIIIEEDSFIGARSFILPGITIGKKSIIGACSLISKNIPPNMTAYGNPAKIVSSKKSI